jgi:hypothetical protein
MFWCAPPARILKNKGRNVLKRNEVVTEKRTREARAANLHVHSTPSPLLNTLAAAAADAAANASTCTRFSFARHAFTHNATISWRLPFSTARAFPDVTKSSIFQIVDVQLPICRTGHSVMLPAPTAKLC